jgi:beta-lysine 5,6-aminomutase alpha subunit
VFEATRGLADDFQPAPDGMIVQRAHQVLAEAVDLLERIVDDGLLNAIGDGTFGLMHRPADAGRGLEGVVRQGAGYYNPASDLLAEAPTASPGGAR